MKEHARGFLYTTPAGLVKATSPLCKDRTVRSALVHHRAVQTLRARRRQAELQASAPARPGGAA